MPSIPQIESELTEHYNSLVSEIAHNQSPALNPRITQIYSELFIESLEEGYDEKWINTKPGSIEFERLAKMRANAIYFAASKQMRIIEDLQTMSGQPGFELMAENYYQIQNRNWLQAEREMILANAQMARRWHEMQAQKGELPNLTYDTVGDANVRPAHQILEGVTKPIDDDFWKTHYPPIGYRCRCDVQQNDNKLKDAPEEKDLAFINKAFAFNSGIENRVAGEKHPYLIESYKIKEDKIKMMLHCSLSEIVEKFDNIGISSFVDLQDSANFIREYRAAEVLAKKGYQVEMKAHQRYNKKGYFNPDYYIDNKVYDLKSATKTLDDAIENSFESANDQQVTNIVLDITNCTNNNLREAYKLLLLKLGKSTTKVKEVILIKNNIAYKPIKGSR